MTATYPGRWAPTMGDSPQHADGSLTVAGDTWARGLAGLNGAQLARGLEACLAASSGWPPTLPEFRAKALGIPTFSEVAADLVRNKGAQRMPFTVAVWRRVDEFSYRHAPELVAEKLLNRAYQDVFDATMRGEPLPEPLPEVTRQEPEPKPRTREAARAAIDECLAILKPRNPEPPQAEASP